MRVLVDTQIFIFGHAHSEAAAVDLLELLADQTRFEIVFSSELQDQIIRVGRRIGGKDWAGSLIDRIWRAFKIKHVDIAVKNDIPSIELIPGEDLVIYLAALNGDIDVLISENREFIRQAAVAQKLFECLSMQEFLEKYGS